VQLCNRFIPTSRSLRKQVIDDHTTDGEEEDEQAPKKLVDWWAGGFEDLNYTWCQHSSAARLGASLPALRLWVGVVIGEGMEERGKLTEDNYIQNQDNKSYDSTTRCIAPCVAADLGFDGGGCYQRCQHQEESVEGCVRQHDCDYLDGLFGDWSFVNRVEGDGW
jgi:hypothetical protein